jgi:hypothetical protein
MHLRAAAIFVLALALPASADAPDAWTALGSLVGDWKGEGTGQPGEGAGGFTFERALGEKVFVRKNFAEYPAGKERPAFRHEDLMVVYRDGAKARADYWDNEGHVIRYEVSAGEGRVVFLSEAGPGVRFRLTYSFPEKDRIDISFEIAPPGKPDAFKQYIAAKARRAQPQ